MMILKAREDDLKALLSLYTHLHDNPFPSDITEAKNIWARILSCPGHFILLGWEDGFLVSSCVLVVIENLTNMQRPYALIENVITHPAYRKCGFASRILDAAREIAMERHCYKIMLLTGSKEQSTLDFYRRAGYNSEDKTAFIQWLP